MPNLPNHIRYKLLYGPYEPPRVRPGEALFCERRQEDVIVGGYTDAPIPWPRARKKGRQSLIVCCDLVRAIRTESELAITRWWGVSVTTVWTWRRALSVGRITDGTLTLYENYVPEKLTEEVLAKAREEAAKPENIKKMADKKRGKPGLPENTERFKELIKRKPRSESWRSAQSAAVKLQWQTGKRRNKDEWTPNEISLLGTAPDREIAQKTGRTIAAVRQKRKEVGLKAFKSGH